ncbi:MAG TPA: DUF4142 domain-containing protein [Candidatus Cybelea sp.]|nr:DUF4142 domain-containing protein [Candidatus Cybelea sp.]
MRTLARVAAVSTFVAVAPGCAVQLAGEPECWRTLPTPSDYRVEEAGRAGTVNDQDRYFICHATIVGRADVALSEMAVRKAADPEVRSFAQRAIADIDRTGNRLSYVVATYDGVDLPDRLDAAHEAMIARLGALSGPAFDQAYLRSQAEDAENALRLYRQEMLSGGEPKLQNFAASTVPALEQTLQMSQSVEARSKASELQTPATGAKDR